MKKTFLAATLLMTCVLASCGAKKSYNAYIVDNDGQIVDTVLNIRKSIDATAENMVTIMRIQFGKADSSAADKTLSLSDIKAYTNGTEIAPVQFANGIGYSEKTTEKYHYASLPSTEYTLKLDEAGVSIKSCYVCFPLNAVTKDSKIKVKGQEINHDSAKATEISL